MLHMMGISPLQYYIGMFFGDLTLHLFPVTLFSLLFIPFPSIMSHKALGEFFVVYLLFGFSFIPVVYTITHLFDEIETATKYVGLIMLLGLIFVPGVVITAIALLLPGDTGDGFSKTISAFVVIDPLLTFGIGVWNTSTSHKSALEDLNIDL